MKKKKVFLLGIMLCLYFQGCTRHKVEIAPVEVKPIHITIDVNVKVQKALDDYFGELDEWEKKIDKTDGKDKKDKPNR